MINNDLSKPDRVVPVATILKMNSLILKGIAELEDGKTECNKFTMIYKINGTVKSKVSNIVSEIYSKLSNNKRFVSLFNEIKTNGVSIEVNGDDYNERIKVTPDRITIILNKLY